MKTKIIFAMIAILLMPFFTSCMSLAARQRMLKAQQRNMIAKGQAAAKQKIEAINFEIEPPDNDPNTMLMSDDKLKSAITGTWKCIIHSFGYSETKINNKITLAFNTPPSESQMIYSFFPDGKFENEVNLKTKDVKTGKAKNTITKKYGNWKVKNGELSVDVFVEEHNSLYTCFFILKWLSADSFVLMYTPESYVKMITSAFELVKDPKNFKVTRNVEFYNAKSSNSYFIYKQHIIHPNGYISDTKVITKMEKMVFTKAK